MLLITQLKRDEAGICETWHRQLSSTSLFEGMTDEGTDRALRGLLRDVVCVLEGRLPSAKAIGEVMTAQRDDVAGRQTGLCQCFEVLLTGEDVTRHWLRTHSHASEAELLEWDDALSGAVHQLIRLYTLRYCAGLPDGPRLPGETHSHQTNERRMT